MDNFDKDQIKKAINKFQDAHPQMVWHDVTKIKDEESIDIIRSQIDIIARKIQEDTEMYIVCEMTKKYLEGARPVYYKKRPTGKWTPVKDWDGDTHYECSNCGRCQDYHDNYCRICGAKMERSGDNE